MPIGTTSQTRHTMRISITFDGASTEAVRELAAALANVGLRQSVSVGCDGPESWGGSTPKLTPQQFASVVGRIVKYNDVDTLGDAARRGGARRADGTLPRTIGAVSVTNGDQVRVSTCGRADIVFEHDNAGDIAAALRGHLADAYHCGAQDEAARS